MTYRTASVLAFLALAILASSPLATAQNGNFPMVVLASDGTGDFGPQTAGTVTSGMQEALNYCVQNNRDLFIKGGPGVIYDVNDTIRVSPARDLKIDGGQYTLNWKGAGGKDLLVVDSCKNCFFIFGVLKYGGTAAALRIKPEHAVTNAYESITAVIDSEIEVGSITSGDSTGANGVIFDTSVAPIQHSSFSFDSVVNLSTGIRAPGTGQQFAYNLVKSQHLRTNVASSTLVVLGANVQQNDFKLGIGVDNSATGVTGVQIFGVSNTIDLISRGGFATGGTVTFEASAAGNKVAFTADNVTPDAAMSSVITDLATNPTNRITWTGNKTLIGVRTVTATVGVFSYTQRLFPATVRVVGGTVSSIKFWRSGVMVDYGAGAGDILMEVGDRLDVTSTVAPSIQIIPQIGS